ncbi:MAG TPA: cell division/cell wall cluster transcriptional repressor MraZ, partial [Clostridiales bacterium]|nr:cell division/cell wall cluster transcriptional repressor MraZ [Clostridiales bacterium]
SIQFADEEGQDFVREFFENGCECEVDKQGRILLPQPLREYIGVEKEMVITGVRNRAEIWSKEGFAARKEKRQAGRDKMKARLFDLGI